MMSTFVTGQVTEICPAKTDKVSASWAEYDGSRAEVMELLGTSRSQRARVKLVKGERTGTFVLPVELLKPV